MMPSYTDEMTSIDLMRYSKEAPSGIMDFLFINLFEKAKEDGFQTFNAGMAPLANVGESKYAFLGERLAGLVYRYSQGFTVSKDYVILNPNMLQNGNKICCL